MFHGRGLERRINSQEKEKSIENQSLDEHNLYFLNLHGLQLITLEASQIYSSLRICILCKNFISDISPLQKCTKLIKLDLHSNQIRMLPDKTFWSEMKELKLLFLHNNSFVKLKNVCSLSACPNLVALTLYDCPVTLKKGYRHVLVNSIWSLKILDHFVISDEEIIENWPLPERFSTFNKRLFCDITPQFFKETSYERELWQVNYIIAKINKIVAHNSPVVILQRWIRGHLTRGMWLKHYLNWLQTRRYQVPGKKINLEQKVKERKFPAFEDLSFFRETEEKQIPDERKTEYFQGLNPVLLWHGFETLHFPSSTCNHLSRCPFPF
ncbi:leucine-rich repeat and IQ domain-containing protein 3 isoform X2 [Macrotis lagotis]